jgi:hypothetical protein
MGWVDFYSRYASITTFLVVPLSRFAIVWELGVKHFQAYFVRKLSGSAEEVGPLDLKAG